MDFFALSEAINQSTHRSIQSKPHDVPFLPLLDYFFKIIFGIYLRLFLIFKSLLLFSGDKPYACPWEGCQYRSTHSGHVKKHYLGHTGKYGTVFALSLVYTVLNSSHSLNKCFYPPLTFSHQVKSRLRVTWKTVGTGRRRPAPWRSTKSHIQVHSTLTIIRLDMFHQYIGVFSFAFTGVKPYFCMVPNCDFASIQSGSLKRHQLTHTGRIFISYSPKLG